MAANPEKKRLMVLRSKLRLRSELFTAYGGKCQCCGETRWQLLCIDHINGGGNGHRRQLKELGTTVFAWLRKNGYPPGYRVLCHNCNMSIAFWGSCPHATGDLSFEEYAVRSGHPREIVEQYPPIPPVVVATVTS